MPEHLVPLAILVVVASLLCAAARRTPGRWLEWVAVIIAGAIVITELSWQPYVIANHSWSAAYSLPVQLCDVGGFVAAAALIWRQLLLIEIAYFWGLGGTLQALLTPDLRDHFPSFPYLQFYASTSSSGRWLPCLCWPSWMARSACGLAASAASADPSDQRLDAEITTVLHDANPASFGNRSDDLAGEPVDRCLVHG